LASIYDNVTGRQWLRPVILTAWEAEIGRISAQGHIRQTVSKTHLQNDQSKMNWRCGSSGRMSALISNPTPTNLSIYLPIYLFIHLSIHLSSFFFIHLFICAYIVWGIFTPCLPPLSIIYDKVDTNT
jgi:hypothetical protein